MLSSATDLLNSIKSSKDSIMNSLKSLIFNNVENYNPYIYYVQLGLSWFYGLHLFLALLSLLSVLLFAICNVRWMKGLNHWWWCTFNLAIILGFLLAFVFAILAIVLSDVCGLFSIDSLTS